MSDQTSAKPTSPEIEAPASGVNSISDLRLFAYIVLVAFGAVFLTADRSLPYDIDPFMNVATAEQFASSGSPVLIGLEQMANSDARAVFGWISPSQLGPVSQYPPGTALFAAPFYLLNTGTTTSVIEATNDPDADPLLLEVPSLWPAAIAGSLAVALAAGFTAMSVRSVTHSVEYAIAAAVLLLAGTGLWLNGGYQLWQHGVSSLWIAAGLWAASRGRWLGSGVLLGLAILTRPPVAIVSAVLGVGASIRQRSLRPAVLHGLGAAAGFALLLAYNYWLFGRLTVTGGYSSSFAQTFVEDDAGSYLRNILGGLFNPQRGLFLWSPFLAVALLGVRKVWRSVPGWAAFAAVGGLVLLLVQFRANRFSGGSGFFSYRYPLETVTASVPLLAAAAQSLAANRTGKRALLLTAAASLGLHLAALIDELWRS